MVFLFNCKRTAYFSLILRKLVGFSLSFFFFQGREVYKEFMFNLTKALGATNDSYNDIIDVINFEIQLAQVCTSDCCSNR